MAERKGWQIEGFLETSDGKLTIDGVTATPVGANAMRFEVTGNVGRLLDCIAGRDVVAIAAREPSLEEVFLHHYGAADGRSA